MSLRKSKRTSAVKKRRLLEEKLEQRKERALRRQNKSRLSKSSKESEAAKNNVPKNKKSLSENSEESQGDSRESLEWDHSDETAPSFVTNSWESDQLEEALKNLYREASDEEITYPLESTPIDSRRNTSTDYNFLRESVATNPPLRHFSWPPRFPSQEPEDIPLNPILPQKPRSHPQLVSVDLEDTVFEDDEEESASEDLESCLDSILTPRFKHLIQKNPPPLDIGLVRSNTLRMEEQMYSERVRVVKIEAKKVRNLIKTFLPEQVTALDIATYSDRLKEIRVQLTVYDDVVSNLEVDIEELDPNDARIQTLNEDQNKVTKEVTENESKVKEKISELIANKPMTPAEKETLDLKKSRMEFEKEKENKIKVEKSKKNDIARKTVARKVEELNKIISKVESISDLSDQEIRSHMLDTKRWEDKLDNIMTLKDKIDGDLVSLEVEESEVTNLDKAIDDLVSAVKTKVDELEKIDKSRCLYSLSKAVKETAVYPDSFSGNPGENVFDFVKKMKEAIIANQIQEKYQVETLRKHVKGKAKQHVGSEFENLDQALDSLVKHFASTNQIWEKEKNDFWNKYNPKDWLVSGSIERKDIISRTCDFLRKAEILANKFEALKVDIYSKETIALLTKVIPTVMNETIAEEERKTDAKDKTGNSYRDTFIAMKKYMELKLIDAIKLCERSEAMKENVKIHSAASNSINDSCSIDSPDGNKFRNKKKYFDDHNCRGSRKCNEDWGLLGCYKLYEEDTTERRIKFLQERGICFICGKERKDKRFHFKDDRSGSLFCRNRNYNAAQPVRCTYINPSNHFQCYYSAATCTRHAPNNVPRGLIEWLNKNDIRSTISAIFLGPVSKNFRFDMHHPSSIKMNSKTRSQLQLGKYSKNFSNDQLREIFAQDLNVSEERVSPMPEGDVSFIFCKIKGMKRSIQAFFDSGCNCAIFRDGVPQQQLTSLKLRDGPIPIDVATGVTVHALGEWASALPLADGSHQVIRALSVRQVTAIMPKLELRNVLDKLKKEPAAANNKELQRIQVPQCLGGEIDMLLGIQFAKIHPEEVFRMPNGLTIYRSLLAPEKPNEIACIGGPMDAITGIVNTVGAKSAISYMSNLCHMVAKEYSPRLEFFPSSALDHDSKLEEYADRDIPQLEKFIEIQKIEETVEMFKEDNFSNDALENPNVATEVTLDPKEDLEAEDLATKEHDERTSKSNLTIKCSECGESESIVLSAKEGMNTGKKSSDENVPGELYCKLHAHSIQGEIKRFLQQQEAGLDSSFRCIRCRDCKECLKGAGQERMSMIQEAQQQIIRQSVTIDKEKGRAVATLPFLTDPAGKLTDNTRIAQKRLEAVCRKYASDDQVKSMIIEAFNKLFSKGHIVLLDNLPKDVAEKIKNAKPSYTIPFDVAFKEGSVSTPARPVFDASSKTPGGFSLNDLLAKGQPDMVRLIDMVLDWRMGSSAVTGDIRQFYNTIALHEDFWQFQKILLKEDLDLQKKTVVAIIKTLIYGVKPVGNQCEEIIKLLADEIKEEYPEVYTLLVMKRYVDDFGKSTASRADTDRLIKETTEVLAKISMEVKGWTIANEDPPEQLTEDGISVGFAGMTWFPKPDFFKLNIQSLHFGKKRRGKFPPNLPRFDQSEGVSIEKFTPKQITRTNCTSVTARIFDISGLLAPLLLKLKSDLRKLITFEPSWTLPIPDHQRAIWVNNFKIIEEVRDILYIRCSIPSDAVSPVARILLLCDAADNGIVFAAYVGYLRKCGNWSCDLLFGKGLLAQENWTIPQKELHGLSALANLKPILMNSLGSWVDEFHAFSDSEIAICWSIYEKVKLSTFVRNRVINIRSKLGIEILHHVEGKSNPTDCGTRPELISAESVKPGSVWMSGASWMKLSMEKAKEAGVVKSAQEIKLSNDEKKVFKKELVYDTFENDDHATFAVMTTKTLDNDKVKERIIYSNYIFPPLKRGFRSLVRITALVLVAVRKFKKLGLKKQIERNEKSKEALRNLDFPAPKFAVFNIGTENKNQEVKNNTKLSEEFNIDSYIVKKNLCYQTNSWSSEEWSNNQAKLIKLTDEELSAALDYLFKKAANEVKEFNKEKDVEKIAIEEDGVLYHRSRLLEAAEIKAVGHLAETINLETFTGIGFKVPVIDQHSPLAISISIYLHYVKYPHKGAETLHRLSMQHCMILKGRQIFNHISKDCDYCKKIRKKLAEQMMGPLDSSQTSIAPVFYFTLIDLWGPLPSFVPGYEKITRSSASKPQDVYMMVCACAATGTINCQVIEGRKTGFCLDGLNRFFSETAVPKIIYTDEEGGLLRGLAHGEVDLVDLSGVLSRQRGVEFVTVVPQGHSGHGRIERRIRMLQQSLEQSELRKSRCTALGWQTIGKLLEHKVNSIPIGFLQHQAGGQNNLLRVLTPNSLKLITTSDRAPAGLFDIPDTPNDLMEKIKEKYEAWYNIWNTQYLPLIMNRQKWHFKQENFKPGDIIYFKITESKMHADWKLGKVEEVKVGPDGFVREATVSYKDVSSNEPADWMFRTVNRPVRNMVKLFNVEDTTLMDDIKNIHGLAEKILEKNRISYEESDSGTLLDKNDVVPQNVTEKEEVSKLENIEFEAILPPLAMKKKKRKKTEVEKLKIEMKGWNLLDAATTTTAHDKYEVMFSKSIAAADKAEVECRAGVREGMCLGLEMEDEFNMLCDNLDESLNIFMI